MTYNIENESDLTKALKECKDGDKILDISHDRDIRVDESLIIDKSISFIDCHFSIEGLEICFPSNIKGSIIVTKSASFINCGFYGNPVKSPTTWQKDGLQALIKADGASFINMDGCYLEGGSYMALWLFDCMIANVFDCSIRLCATKKEGYGFGYGIWQGGKGNAKDQVLSVSNCSFENNRHCIAGSKHPNHIYVTGCNFKGGQYSQHILDRHGENGIGGGNYYIFSNTFEAPDRYAYDLAKPATGQVLIEGNTFARPEANGRIGGLVYSGNTNNLAV